MLKEFKEEGASDAEVEELRSLSTNQREQFIQQYLQFESSIEKKMNSKHLELP
jgi:hypothetical protein